MGVNIFVDDVRDPPNGSYVLCRTSQQALAVLAGIWTHQQEFTTLADFDVKVLSLDHDLSDDDTILPVVKFLCALGERKVPLRIETVHIHSSNIVGVRYMADRLGKFYRVTFP